MSKYTCIRLWALSFCFIVAVLGHMHINAYMNGFEAGINDCYGMPCEEYTLLIGKASKEARATKKPKQVASVWEALHE